MSNHCDRPVGRGVCGTAAAVDSNAIRTDSSGQLVRMSSRRLHRIIDQVNRIGGAGRNREGTTGDGFIRNALMFSRSELSK
jgi:hypothetical protein